MNQNTQPITREEEYRLFVALFISGIFFLPKFDLPIRRIFSNNWVANIIGGIIVAVLIEVWIKCKNYYSALKFRNIFGDDVIERFFIVYGLMDKIESFPFSKAGVPYGFGNLTPTSAAQLRGVKYISQLFGRNVRTTPDLATDVELKDRMDISFCSIGGKNNWKTIDVEDHESNTFFKFDGSPFGIVGKSNPQLKFTSDGPYDYGFIIKIKPNSLGNRTWIGIAGLGEWGTSGGAWYLARNWKEIEKNYGDKPFGLIVKVKDLQDESAQLVYQ